MACWTLFLAGALCAPMSVHGQFIFLDTDGDKASTVLDRLDSDEATVEIILRTDANKDGSPIRHESSRGVPATINSYEFILRAVNGSVSWGEYKNLQPSMTMPLGTIRDDSEFYTGFAGESVLPPGTYSLGRLTLKVKDGSPQIVFASRFKGSRTYSCPTCATSFGSMILGKDLDNTLKFAEDAALVGGTSADVPGDWSGASVISTATADHRGLESAESAAITKLELLALSNPLRPGGALRLRLPASGPVTLRLFDPAGRLVGTVLDHRPFEAGEHALVLSSVQLKARPLSSGVYFYRLISGSTQSSGRLIVIR